LTIVGLTREEGMIYATISHSVTSIMFVLLGAVSMMYIFYGKRFRKKTDAEEKHVEQDTVVAAL